MNLDVSKAPGFPTWTTRYPDVKSKQNTGMVRPDPEEIGFVLQPAGKPG